MESNQALYYPYVHFKNDGWVKLSALYWDKLLRIVPHSYPTDDSATVRALGSFIAAVRPETVRPAFADAFGAFINGYGARLQARYGLAGRDSWPVVPQAFRPPLAGGPTGTDPRLGYVHNEKLNHFVYQAMVEYDLASPDDLYSAWIGMHARLADVYMHAMADHLAADLGLRALTDETFDHVAATGMSLERLATALLDDVDLVGTQASPSESETLLFTIAFRSLMPVDIDTLSVDRILRFRADYADERHNFQAEVGRLLGSSGWLHAISNPRVLEERIRDEIDATWSRQLSQLKEKMRSVGIDTVFSCATLSTTLPVAVSGAIGTMGLPMNGLAASTAAVAIAAIPMLRGARAKSADGIATSPIAYLYKVQRDLTPADLQTRLLRRLREFALG